jgi:hypothetical protein
MVFLADWRNDASRENWGLARDASCQDRLYRKRGQREELEVASFREPSSSGSRLRANAHISKSRYGAPAPDFEVQLRPGPPALRNPSTI